MLIDKPNEILETWLLCNLRQKGNKSIKGLVINIFRADNKGGK